MSKSDRMETDLATGAASVRWNVRAGNENAAFVAVRCQVRRARAWGLLPATWGEWFGE